MILSKEILRKIEKLGWDENSIFMDKEVWKKDFVAKNALSDIQMKKEREQVALLFDIRGKEAESLEKSLKDSFEAAKVRSLKILDQMSDKLRKAEEKRHQIAFSRVDDIEDYLKPNGSPQERVVYMMQFYLADELLIDKLFENFDPMDFRMMVLKYED